jgi:hypothetical protein
MDRPACRHGGSGGARDLVCAAGVRVQRQERVGKRDIACIRRDAHGPRSLLCDANYSHEERAAGRPDGHLDMLR